MKRLYALFFMLFVLASACFSDSKEKNYTITESELTELYQIIESQDELLTSLKLQLTDLEATINEQKTLLTESKKEETQHNLVIGIACLLIGAITGIITDNAFN